MEQFPGADRIAAALEQARVIEDPIDRAETLIGLIPTLPEQHRERALHDAREAVWDIKDSEAQVKLMMDLAPHESVSYRDDLLHMALSIAESIGDERLIANVLGESAQAYFQWGDVEQALSMAEQAFKIAESTNNSQLRLRMRVLLESIDAQSLESQSSVAGEEEVREQGVTVEERPTDKTEPSRREPVDIATRALADSWSTEDYLKFADYANALADLIKDKKLGTPLTISIDAPWGMGKTTLMRMIKSRFDGDRSREKRAADETYPTVWFNAWQHDKEESLWAALILEILDQVRPELDWRQRASLWWNLNRERFKPLLWGFLKALLIVLGVLAVVLVAIAVLWKVGTLQEVGLGAWESVKLLGGLGVLLAVYMLGKDIMTFFYKKVIDPFKLGVTEYVNSKPIYEERVGYLNQLKKDFKCVVSRVTDSSTKKPEEEKKLIVFIDDLDRSTPSKTAEVIEAISIMLSSERCVFVLGMDSQMVASSIEVKYKDLQDYLAGTDGHEPALGRRFLEKIVQIPFAIPRTGPKAFNKFIRNNLAVGGQTQEVSAEKVLEAEKLIEQEQEQGKSLDEAAETVRAGSDTSLVEAVAEAKVEIRARSFLRDSAEVERAVSHAAPYLGYNPRKVKRFINLFKLQALIANRRRLLDQGTIELDQLSKWLLISMHWPAVIDAAITDQRFVRRLLQANEAHNKSLSSRTKEGDRQQAESDLARLREDSRIDRFYRNNELNELLDELRHSRADASLYLSLTEVTSGTS
jgi:tetratricopeptide (TPR) repeat protein